MKKFSKRSIFFLLAFIWLWLLPARTMAFTIEPRVGFGQVNASNIDAEAGPGVVIQTGLDIYFYEGRNLDLFVGAEYASLPNGDFRISGQLFRSSVEITAATFGIHLKPATSSRFKPYLSLGGIGGLEDFETKSPGGSSTILSQSTDSTNFMAARGGLGVNIGLGKRFGLGLEASYTGPIPAFKAVSANQATGEVKEIRLWEGNSQIVFSLGLRYSF